MKAVSAVLAGFQLALVPEVEAYWLENSTPDSRNGSTTATYSPEKITLKRYHHETLKVIQKSGKPHHTETPKL